MRQGQLVNGYLVVSKPTNAGAGKCLWAFAEKDGEEYFIKEFLDPKRPRPDGMGSPADKQRRLAACRRFEHHHRKVFTILRADHLHAGNLVLATDFFADGTRYYKVTRRVHGTDIAPHTLTPELQIILLRTLADSLRLLHGSGIVHGDLKPDNVLLHQPKRSDLYTAKLIDFDDAYPAGDPPGRDLVGGNPLYGAPEWLRYLRGDTAVGAKELTQAVDMFALGLLIHTYLFGTPPAHDPAYDSPAGAVLDGAPLRFDPALGSGWLAGLLSALTRRDPTDRPDITQTAGLLDRADIFDPAPASGPGSAERSRVRVNLGGRLPAKSTSRLRINLNGHRP